MSGDISYEVLITDAAGQTEATRYAGKEDARLEVERILRFHPYLSARLEVIKAEEHEEEAPPAADDPDLRLVCCAHAIHLLLCHLCGRRAVAPISERNPGRDCPECGAVMLWEARECVATPSFPGHGRYDADGPVRQKPPSFETGVAQGSLF